MSRYNSENSKVLENRNGKMLLLHEFEDGRHEYIVGSNFTVTWYDGACGYMRQDYSWDWGHYFNNIVSAAMFWKEVAIG